MCDKPFREVVEKIHADIWQETVSRFDLRSEEPEGMLIANVASYDDGYITTVAQMGIDPSDMVNIGVELMTSGVVQLIQTLMAAQETTEDEEIKELSPIDICEAGIDKAVNQLRRGVRRVVTDMLKDKETEGREIRVIRKLTDDTAPQDELPSDAPVQ